MGEFTMVKVDMGEPRPGSQGYPLAEGGEGPVTCPWKRRADLPHHHCLHGEPHCIIPVDDVEGIRLEEVGPQIERHSLFPKKTNVEFVQFSPHQGQGPGVGKVSRVTLACGTGACATGRAGHLLGKTERKPPWPPGGDLTIEWADNNHLYDGPGHRGFPGRIPGTPGIVYSKPPNKEEEKRR